MHMALRRGPSLGVLLAGSLVVSLLSAPPSQARTAEGAAVVAGEFDEIPEIESNPSGGKDQSIKEFGGPGLPDKLSELPEGDGTVDPRKTWAEVDGLPIEVRATDKVTTLGESTDAPAVTESQDTEVEAPPVDIEAMPTAQEATPGIVLSVTPQTTPAADGETPTDTPSSGERLATDPPAAESVEAVEVRVSYADFRYAFGGDWGSRLRVLALPACYATDPEDAGCSEGVEVPSRNSVKDETVSFTTVDLAARTEMEPAPTPSPTASPAAPEPGGDLPGPEATPTSSPAARSAATLKSATSASTSGAGTVYLLAAGASGEAGDYSATPLSPSAGWQVGESAGSFGYSYPFELAAPVVAGSKPSLGLSYNSGSLDGMTKAANGQASMAGIGWSMEPGYVTRNYASCSKDGYSTRADLCWKTVNGTLIEDLSIVLNGRSSRLIRVTGASNTFRLQDDPGWQVTRASKAGTPSPDEPDNTDDNNEAFKVVSRDGTTYWFGWGRGRDSTSLVPVYGNHSGEPCYSSGSAPPAFCMQAWRWNLDRVVDRFGNSIDFEYAQETNYYARWHSFSGVNKQAYNRSSYLTRITYGQGRNGGHTAVSEAVIQTRQRCTQAAQEVPTECASASPRGAPAAWPDVPADLVCYQSDSSCTNYAPTFFSLRRYESVATVRTSGASSWTVDKYQLKFGFPTPGNDPDGIRDLWLEEIRRTGYGASGTLQIPAVNFDGQFLANRVDTSVGAAFNKRRVVSIRNEAGGRVDVEYGHDDGRTCTPSNMADVERWNSTRECYPAQLNGDWEWWHKYVVTRVSLADDAFGYRVGATTSDVKPGRLRVFDYDYVGAPGWAYRPSQNIPNTDETWDDWRGYEMVKVSQRKVGSYQAVNAGSHTVRTVSTFRGLDGTKLNNTANGTVSEVVPTVKGDRTDSPWMAGRVAQEIVTSDDGTILSRTNTDYGRIPTADSSYGPSGHLVYPETAYSVVRGGGPERRVDYTVDTGGSTHRGIRVGAETSRTDNQGTATTGDDLVTKTNWIVSAGSTPFALVYTKSVELVEDPESGPKLQSQIAYSYDDPLIVGALTVTDTSVSATSGKWVRTRHVSDGYGRETKVSLPYAVNQAREASDLDGGAKYVETTFERDGSTDDMVTGVRVEQPSPTSAVYETVTTLDDRRATPKTVTDPAGQVTKVGVDALGRTIWVDLPGRTTTPHSIEYSYTNSINQPSTVTTKVLQTDGGAVATSRSWTDGWGRPVESQRLNAAGTGRIVSSTSYDERGLVWASVPSGYKSGAAFAAENPTPSSNPHWTRTTYDDAGLVSRVEDMSGGATNSTTVHGYSPSLDAVAVVDGAYNPMAEFDPESYTETTLDSLMRPKKVVQYDDGTSGPADPGVANYTYTPTGQLASITKPRSTTAGEVATYTYTYDRLGRRTGATDPDTGASTYVYDARGNLTKTTNALSSTVGEVETEYDVLSRPTVRKQTTGPGTANGPITLVAWSYDTTAIAGGGTALGRLSEVTVDPAAVGEFGTFTSKVDEYDPRGNVLEAIQTYPAALTGQNGGVGTVELMTSTGYNQAGQVIAAEIPAVADLPALDLSTTYYPNGAFQQLSVDGGPVIGRAAYDDIDRPGLVTSELTAADENRLERFYDWNNQTDRLTTLNFGQDLTPVNQAPNPAEFVEAGFEYLYDTIGNPTEVRGTRQEDPESAVIRGNWCYGYDLVGRLRTAKAGAPVSGDVGCGAGTAASDSVTGTSYDLTYAFAQGRLSSVTNPATQVSYTYPDSPTQPHAAGTLTLANPAATAVEGLPTPGLLNYDDLGRVKEWDPGTDGGNDETKYTYDVQGNLIKTDRHETADDATYAYAHDGIRLARKTEAETVLYLGGQELVFDGSVLSARRTFSSPGGTPLAVQEGDGDEQTAPAWTWLGADLQGSVRLSKDAADGNSSVHAYYPYGGLIGNADGLPGERGFLNKPRDPDGTVRLDHRMFDPGVNVLTTPDPLLVPEDPQSLNPYTYSGHNPITLSDPSGLIGGPGPILIDPDIWEEEGGDDAPGGSSGGGSGGGAGGGSDADEVAAFVAAHDAWVTDLGDSDLTCSHDAQTGLCAQANLYRRWLWSLTRLDPANRTEFEENALTEWKQRAEGVSEDVVVDTIISVVATGGLSLTWASVRGSTALAVNGVVAKTGTPALQASVKIPLGNPKYGLEHILRRHSFNSFTMKPASKFSRGMGHIGIRRVIRDAVARGGTWEVQGSRRVLETSLGRTIGTDLAGNSTRGLRIVTDEAGSVITAYPIAWP